MITSWNPWPSAGNLINTPAMGSFHVIVFCHFSNSTSSTVADKLLGLSVLEISSSTESCDNRHHSHITLSCQFSDPCEGHCHHAHTAGRLERFLLTCLIITNIKLYKADIWGLSASLSLCCIMMCEHSRLTAASLYCRRETWWQEVINYSSTLTSA